MAASRVWLVTLLIAAAWLHHSVGALTVGYYDRTCSSAESIVRGAVRSAVSSDRTIAASLLRLHFHDCFVQGCDASILLTGSGTEQTAFPNQSIRGYNVIAAAKSQLEASCPGVVSCADIVALAARDSVAILGGAFYDAETGRSDGTSPGAVNLPQPNMSIDQAAVFFTNLGLTLEDMVILLGSHTVGVSQCQFFVDRLYNFGGTGKPDPTLNTAYLAQLQSLCPNVQGGTNNVALDLNSEFSFDTSYYRNIQANKGLLQIDQEIGDDARTSGTVNTLAASSNAFGNKFGTAIVAMGRIGALTSGKVRAVCDSA